MIPILDINLIAWITGAPVAFGIIITAIIGVSLWALRLYNYQSSPTPYRVGDYSMAMTHLRKIWKMTIFERDFVVDTDFIESLKALDITGKLAEAFEKNKDNLHFYIGRHMSAEGTTEDSGLSLIMTNAPLNHSDYYIELEEHNNWIKGVQTHVRRVSDSGPDGLFIKDTGKSFKGKELNFVYYTLSPITKNPSVPPKQLEMVEATMAAVANAEQMVLTLRQSKMNKIERDAAIEGKEKAESELKKVKEEFNFVRRQWAKKDYWASNMSVLGNPLSMAVIIAVVGGAAIVLPDIFQQNFAGYQPYVYRGLAVGLGGLGLWIISSFRNKG